MEVWLLSLFINVFYIYILLVPGEPYPGESDIIPAPAPAPVPEPSDGDIAGMVFLENIFHAFQVVYRFLCSMDMMH